MNRGAFEKLWNQCKAESDRPQYMLLADEPLAVFCVCGFLRWAFESEYTSEDWAYECDIYFLTPKGA